MPVYMDRHYVEGATRHAIADAHHRDLTLQDKYDVGSPGTELEFAL